MIINLGLQSGRVKLVTSNKKMLQCMTPRERGGDSLVWAIWVCAALKGMVFQLFWSNTCRVSILADFDHRGHK